MEEYKREIYSLWSKYNPNTFCTPDEGTIKGRIAYYEYHINNFLPKGKDIKILDIGSGYGFFLIALKNFGYNDLTAVEINPACVDYLNNELKIKAVEADFFEYLERLDDNSLDVVSAIDVIEHIEKDKILMIFKLILRKLKSDGIFIFQVPNGGSLSGLTIFNSDLTHEVAFTSILIREVFTLSGFNSSLVVPDKENYSGFKKHIIIFLRYFLSILLSGNRRFIFSTNLIGVGKK